MREILAVFAFVLLYNVSVVAQVTLMPLQQESRSVAADAIKSQPASNSRLQANTLPFFDDFAATTTGLPDPERWETAGGTYINNRYGRNPISIGVASLDGVNAAGAPYAPLSVATGASDTLTSQPIMLGSLVPADSVYLSFYWQSGGLGDVPDRTSNNSFYLVLELLDNAGAWQPVWQQNAVGEVTEFAQVFVALSDGRFLHDGFQFRYRNIGRRTGLADVWNLDYVELDRNRRKGQNTSTDITISRPLTPLLRHYAAMPVPQFLENPQAALSEEVVATVNNLGSIPGAISWRGYIKLAEAGSPVDTFLRAPGLVPGEARQFEVSGTPRITNLPLPQEAFKIVQGLFLDTREQNPLQRANDTVRQETQFADYFAYDDGTAEAGFSFISSSSTQVAQLYELNRPDQLRAFRVYFPQVGNSLEGTSLIFRVWNDADGVPGESVYQQAFQIRYSEVANQFYEVVLPQPLNVSDRFYIGWSQPGGLFVNIGFDRNSSAAGRRFLWGGVNGWVSDAFTEGAVMMRPVMTGEALSVAEEIAADPYFLYPNPTTGPVFIDGIYRRISVYDMMGRTVHSQVAAAAGKPVALGHLPAGMYTVHIETSKGIIVKKIMVTK
ncbi:T9SS type A sorting domain-containing protein [Pontibacter qinzhouensis]|uniref:T9SS type A sorting domain-containing protein n=1 Tax=Pontibacter qinzhouensis TaxID=2603253 RepID=A0A5C8K4R6_9BACT|nr:T9SS type A sorting domain-containing protein [Pontibacter qinzhouensis]TXK44860.1 T9SS type A sorting domain-containing protein [Pontibacter qinzhouensis]